nr:hypothetical protein [uncultured Campylobacter sp.]
MEIYDFLKVILGAALTICGQWIYVNLNTKKDKNKLRRQKLEETFIIIEDILEGMNKDRLLLIKPDLNIENPKIEAGKLHLLISFYAPELQEDYEDFMATYQDFLSLYVRTSNINNNINSNDMKNMKEKLVKIHLLLVSKGNIIEEKLIIMAKKL